MASKRRLGKGLNEIFGDDIDSILNDISNNGNNKNASNNIEINKIRPNPYQPRRNFDEQGLQELAQSIKENGVFQPIIVRKSLTGYELVAGERRLRASKIANKKEIPAIVVDFDDKQMMEISLLENIQRKDLSPIEEASAYNQLIRKLNYTQDELARRIGKSRANVTNLLRLLNLPDEVKKLVNDNKLSYGQARTLLSLDKEDKIIEMANKAVRQGLSVRQLERLCSEDSKEVVIKKPARKNPFIKDVEERLQRKLDTKVEIKKKQISIQYNNNEDLNRILEIIGVIED